MPAKTLNGSLATLVSENEMFHVIGCKARLGSGLQPAWLVKLELDKLEIVSKEGWGYTG